MMKLEDIKLGIEIRDKLTGLEGIIVSRGEYNSGMIQFGVQPISKDGKFEDAYMHDWQGFDYVGPGIADRVIEPTPHTFNLNDKVKDLDSNIAGVIVLLSTHLNGCTTARICYTTKDGKVSETIAPMNRMELVKASTPSPKKKIGGPATRIQRERAI
jgi:hypothetical protein